MDEGSDGLESLFLAMLEHHILRNYVLALLVIKIFFLIPLFQQNPRNTGNYGFDADGDDDGGNEEDGGDSDGMIIVTVMMTEAPVLAAYSAQAPCQAFIIPKISL